MTAAQKLEKAKRYLALRAPFYAYLALTKEYQEYNGRPTCCTNGKQIFYNSGFIERITVDELQGVIAHEILHIGMCHHTRRNGRDNELWNIAADYAINPIVRDSGLTLPQGALMNDRFKNMTAEEIYSILVKEAYSPSNEPSMGEVEDAHGLDQDLKNEERVIKQQFTQAAMIAKVQKKLPPALQRFIQQILKPKVDWRAALAAFLLETVNSDYSWRFPNKRHLHANLYLPSLYSEEVGRVILITDTSISIYDHLLDQISSEIHSILNTFNVPLTVMFADDDVRSIQDIYPYEPFQLKPVGRGGTDYIPAFDYIEQNDLDPTAVVYLTDGECYSFPQAPSYPVLWAKFDDYPFNPPFGDVIHIR